MKITSYDQWLGLSGIAQLAYRFEGKGVLNSYVMADQVGRPSKAVQKDLRRLHMQGLARRSQWGWYEIYPFPEGTFPVIPVYQGARGVKAVGKLVGLTQWRASEIWRESGGDLDALINARPRWKEHAGVSAICRATGMSRNRVNEGLEQGLTVDQILMGRYAEPRKPTFNEVAPLRFITREPPKPKPAPEPAPVERKPEPKPVQKPEYENEMTVVEASNAPKPPMSKNMRLALGLR